MIEYALLCQTISDWRAGRRPVLPSPSSSSSSATPTIVASGGTAPIDVGSFGGDEEEAEVLEAGEAIDDDGYPATEVEADVPVEDEYATIDAAAPPDFDSTMVYGAGGAMPGQWPAEGEPEPEAPASDEHEPPRS